MRHGIVNWQDLIVAASLWGVFFTVLTWQEVASVYLLVSVAVPVLGLIILAQTRLAKQKRFRMLLRGKDRGVGDELISYIDRAAEYILLCHFRNESPSEKYVNALNAAHLRNVRINRLVSCEFTNLSKDSSTEWIVKQVVQHLANHRYIPIHAETGTWEVYIFDGKYAALALPSVDPASEGDLPNVLVSDEQHFVRSMESLFLSYWNRAEGIDA